MRFDDKRTNTYLSCKNIFITILELASVVRYEHKFLLLFLYSILSVFRKIYSLAFLTDFCKLSPTASFLRFSGTFIYCV